MMIWLSGPTAAFTIRVILGLLLFVSGLLKLPALKKFYIIFLQYGVLKGRIAKLAAYTLPFAEIILGLSVLAGFMLRLFSGIAVLYFMALSFGVGFAMYSHKKLKDCGCYGVAMKSPVNFNRLAENLLWLALAAYLFILTVR